MKTFYVGIKAVIIQDGRVLLIKSSDPDRVLWEVPGGRIDGDETIEQALRREVSEEVPNISNVQVGQLLDAYRVQRDVDGVISLVLLYFAVTADFDGDIQLSHEHTDARWVSAAEADELAHESVLPAVQKAFALIA